jgi:hypothetical protein
MRNTANFANNKCQENENSSYLDESVVPDEDEEFSIVAPTAAVVKEPASY